MLNVIMIYVSMRNVVMLCRFEECRYADCCYAVSFCWLSLLWMSLWRVCLCRMSLYWVSWRHVVCHQTDSRGSSGWSLEILARKGGKRRQEWRMKFWRYYLKNISEHFWQIISFRRGDSKGNFFQEKCDQIFGELIIPILDQIQEKLAARCVPMWQHRSQICLETFILKKNHTFAKNSITTKARKNTHKFGILRILEIFSWIFD